MGVWAETGRDKGSEEMGSEIGKNGEQGVREQRRVNLPVVRGGAPTDSHDPKEQTEPPRMPGNAPDNLLHSPPGLWPKDLLWEGKLQWTCILTEWHGREGRQTCHSAAVPFVRFSSNNDEL